LEALSDERTKVIDARERCTIGISAREHFVGRRSCSETRVQIHRRGRPGPGPARDQRRPRQSIDRSDQFEHPVDVEHLWWIRDDVLRLRNSRLHLGVRHAPLHCRELFATEEQPRRGPGVTSKRLRIGYRSPVESEICGHLETRHMRNVLTNRRTMPAELQPIVKNSSCTLSGSRKTSTE
jgi:hypothetical protein